MEKRAKAMRDNATEMRQTAKIMRDNAKASRAKNKQPAFEVVSLAEVRRLNLIADELRQVANDAQDNADTANRRANTAQRKANSAGRSRKEDVNQTAARILREATKG